ncbi:MAG TPA: hypothetical protein PLD79_07900, partial [Halothiobacillus sp.]|nr:hypothetical protein [Halothiobacillus sp.]
LFLIAGLLSGCANTIFDPVPFDPINGSNIQSPKSSNVSFSFCDYNKSTASLDALTQAYKAERNDLMRQKPFLDIPIIGLGLAGVANAAFGGARAATTALGIGTAAGYGVNTYVGGGIKITAYNTAQQGFACAAIVSRSMGDLNSSYFAPDKGDSLSLKNLDEKLQADIKLASDILTGKSDIKAANTTESQSLLAAQNAAVAAEKSFSSAQQTLLTGPSNLEIFTMKLLRLTDDTAYNGVEDPAKFISTVQASITQPAVPVSPPKPATAPAASSHAKIANSGTPVPLQSVADIVTRINAEDDQANAFSGSVTKN